MVKDLSQHHSAAHTSFRLVKGGAQYPVAVGDVVAFAGNYYRVDAAGAAYKLTKIREINPVDDPKKQAPDTLEGETPAEGATVGRLKKNTLTIPHPDCSGAAHATFTQTTVSDNSTNGTFIVYNSRPAFVPVAPGTGLKISDFELSFK